MWHEANFSTGRVLQQILCCLPTILHCDNAPLALLAGFSRLLSDS